MARVPHGFNFKIVVYPNPDEQDAWLAHCLEMDLMGFGPTVQAAVEELLGAIKTQIAHAGEVDQVFFPAPEHVWQLVSECQVVPDELFQRAWRNVFEGPATFTAQTLVPKTAARRVEREMTPA